MSPRIKNQLNMKIKNTIILFAFLSLIYLTICTPFLDCLKAKINERRRQNDLLIDEEQNQIECDNDAGKVDSQNF